MQVLLVLSLFCYLPGLTLGRTAGSIQVEGFGEVFILPTYGYVEMVDNGFTMYGGGRIYFGNTSVDSFTPDCFWQTPLADKHFSYTVDLSNVNCGCCVSSYFVNMPGNPYYGGPDGDFYCDANKLNDFWCPEFDPMEANKYAIASTMHTCSQDANGNWESCDRGGCQVNTYNIDPDMVCPEDRCTINTNNPFKVTTFQNADLVTTTLEQNGRNASFRNCNQGNYVADMAPSFEGMVFSVGLWGGPGNGGEMSWLDGMTGCEEACNIEARSVTFTDFKLFE